MPSFKNSTSGAVATTDAAVYVPLNFDKEREAQPVQSFSFIESHQTSGKSSFEIDPQISKTIGLTDAKDREHQKKFDAEVLRYVQKIKDDAYQEAYKKGLEEGAKDARDAAYREAEAEMNLKIKAVAEVAQALAVCREKMFEVNEQEIIQFCYFMAEKIVFRELKKDPSLILEAIKVVAVHQDEMTLKISPSSYQFLQPHMDQLTAEMNVSKVRFEKDESLVDGEIIVESEQGIVDGTLGTRLKKLKILLDGQE